MDSHQAITCSCQLPSHDGVAGVGSGGTSCFADSASVGRVALVEARFRRWRRPGGLGTGPGMCLPIGQLSGGAILRVLHEISVPLPDHIHVFRLYLHPVTGTAQLFGGD